MNISQIRAEMARQGISRKELSELSGVSQGSLSGYFTKKAEPSKKTLEKLEKALKREKTEKPEFNPRYSPHLLGEASKALGQCQASLRSGIRKGAFPWGRCIEHPAGKKKRSTFMIDRQEFYESYGIVLEIPGKDVSDGEKDKDAVAG